MSEPRAVACFVGCFKLRPCKDTRTAHTTVTSADFPSKQHQSAYEKIEGRMGRNISEQPIIVDLYYKKSSYLITETSEKTSIFDLVSNVGGQLGKT